MQGTDLSPGPGAAVVRPGPATLHLLGDQENRCLAIQLCQSRGVASVCVAGCPGRVCG